MSKMDDDQGSLPGQDELPDNGIVTENDAADSSATGADEKASPSEANTDADDNAALLAVVKQAVKETKGDDTDPSTVVANKDTAKADATTGTPEGNGQGQADADKLLPFHDHPRWKQVLAERDGFRGEAEQYRQIHGFMEKHELQPDEMAEGMLVMGLMKLDPKAALERLEPHVVRLKEFLGLSLPADLQKNVDDGMVTEDIARETAKLRLANQADTSLRERQETDRVANTQLETVAGMKTAVDEWETGARSRDPDFVKKSAFVVDQTQLLIAKHGMPRTPADAVKLTAAAYDTVNQRMKTVIPARAATRKTPTGSRPSHSAAQVPNSMADVVRLAAQQGAQD